MPTSPGGAADGRAPITVAFDALGAEQGPAAVIEGVGMAVGDGVRVRVFGRTSELEPLWRVLASS